MVFEGQIIQIGTSAKPSSKMTSRAFDVAKNIDSATHLRIKGTNEFVEINDKLIIIRKKDSNGSPVGTECHYTQINDKEEFVCVINGKESVIEGTFYTQITFMRKSEKGSFLRCNDGVYVHKDEVQVPAYKKVPLNDNAEFRGPVHGGEFYVQTEEVILPDGKRITLPNPRIQREGDNWVYTNDNNEKIVCHYKKDVDTRRYVRYLLLNNEKIVNVDKLQTRKNGEIVLEDVDGQTVVVGKKKVALERPFVEGTSSTGRNYDFYANNMNTQSQRINKNEALRFNLGDDNFIQVNASRTWVKIYNEGKKEVYVVQGERVPVVKEDEKLIFVSNLDIVDLGEGKARVAFTEMKKSIAQNVRFKNGKLDSYEINDRKITDVRWENIGGLDYISSYVIDGTALTDVEWEEVRGTDGKINRTIKSCKIHLLDEEGNAIVEEIRDLKNSKYRDLAITCELTHEIEDVKTNEDKFSFKMGEYEFKDVELTEDGQVGKCKLKHDDIEEEIDLSTDVRFKQLKLAVSIALDEQKVIPLVRSQLLVREDGKYKLNADVVQTEDTKEVYDKDGKLVSGGVASATEVTSVGKAIEEQERFKQNPFTTTIIDDKNPNRTHTISDFETTYEGAADFGMDNSIIPDLIGKKKIEIKKGDLVLDSKKTNGLVDDMVVMGFALCSNPITLIFGMPLLAAGAAVGIIAPIARSIKKSRIKNQDLSKFKKKIQDNVAEHCKGNINELVASCRRELEACKKLYSQEEYERRKEEILKTFRFNYRQEVAKLQMLGGGKMAGEFDPMKKGKLTPTSHLQYLEYLERRRQFLEGKKDSPRLNIELDKQLQGLEGNDRIAKHVELLKLYGGRVSQLNAYTLQMDNFDYFLEQENLRRKKLHMKGIEPDDYRKQLTLEFNQGKMVWGSLEDKLDAFKSSEEYLKLSKKDQKAALSKKREELVKQADSLKIDAVEFEERLDKNGKPVIQSYTESAMAYLEYVTQALSTGDRVREKFSLDFYEKMSEEEKSLYTTSEKLSDASVRRINTTSIRRMEYDRRVNEQFISITQTQQQQVGKKVEDLKTDGERYLRLRDYEKIFRLEIALQAEEEKFAEDCKAIEKRMASVPHPEMLTEEDIKSAQDELDAIRSRYATTRKLAERAKGAMEKKYDAQVREWALEEFARAHKTEYAWHQKYMGQVSSKGAQLDERSVQLAFFQSMCKNKDKAESYRSELETYRIKHHVEENIEAETFCEVNNEEFLRFIEERNAQSSKGALDPNSELARCYFYAHCKKDNPLRISNFKRYFAKKTTQKAKERLEQGSLVKHDKKIIRSKGAHKTASASPVVTSSAPEQGLTA